MLFSQVAISTTAGQVAVYETAFNSAVQAGVIRAALQRALGSSDVNVLPADPVQAQRFAVAVALSTTTGTSAGGSTGGTDGAEAGSPPPVVVAPPPLQQAAPAPTKASAAPSAPPPPAITNATPQQQCTCSSDGTSIDKRWLAVGIAFVVLFGVSMTVVVGLLAHKAGAASAAAPGKYGYEASTPSSAHHVESPGGARGAQVLAAAGYP